MKIELQIKGLGNVPGKKNSKRIVPARNGHPPMLITDPKIKEFCDQLTASFVSQLLSGSATPDAGTWTAVPLQSLIQLLPPDDCWTCVPILIVSGALCPKGEEGATITIQKI